MLVNENPDVHIGDSAITFMGEIPEEMYYLPAITHALNQHRSSSTAITVQYTVVNDTPIGVSSKKYFYLLQSPRTPNRESVCILEKFLKLRFFDDSRSRGQMKTFLGCAKATCQPLLMNMILCLIDDDGLTAEVCESCLKP